MLDNNTQCTHCNDVYGDHLIPGLRCPSSEGGTTIESFFQERHKPFDITHQVVKDKEELEVKVHDGLSGIDDIKVVVTTPPDEFTMDHAVSIVGSWLSSSCVNLHNPNLLNIIGKSYKKILGDEYEENK